MRKNYIRTTEEGARRASAVLDCRNTVLEFGRFLQIVNLCIVSGVEEEKENVRE